MVKDLSVYDNWKGSFCFLSNLTMFLDYHELYCSESWLGGILGYLGFFYSREKLPSKEVVLGRNTSFEGMFESFQEQLQVPLTKMQAASAEEYISLAGGLLKERRLPLLWIDDFYLPYSPYFGIAHYWSLVAVLQAEGDNARIYDNEVRTLDMNIIRSALTNLEHTSVYCAAGSTLAWKRPYKDGISLGLDKVVSLFSGAGSSDSEGYGIRGMEYLSGDILLFSDSGVFYNLCYQMMRSSGPEATRKSMARLCDELRERWPFPEVEETRSRYTYLAERWNKIGNLLYKMSTTMNDDLRKRITNRITEVVELERDAMEMLSKMLDKLR